MPNSTCLFLLIGMSLCSTAASKEATVYTIYPEEAPIYHEGSGKSIDSLILLLGYDNPLHHYQALSAIREMNLPDDQILLRWARLVRLLGDGRIFYSVPAEITIRMTDAISDAVFRLIDLDKALDGVLDLLRRTNRTAYGINSEEARRSNLARRVIEEFRDKLRDSTIKPLPGTIPLLAEALGEQDPEICEIAATLLGCIPADAKSAVPALFDALGNENERVRTSTVYTLGVIAASNPEVQSEIAEKLIEMLSVPSFVIWLQRYETNFHVRVGKALMATGPAAVPSLLDALNATDANVRHYAAVALAYIDSEHAETIIPTLAEMVALNSSLPGTRGEAVGALEKLAVDRPTLAAKIAGIFHEVIRTIDPNELDYSNDDFKFHAHLRGAFAKISPKK